MRTLRDLALISMAAFLAACGTSNTMMDVATPDVSSDATDASDAPAVADVTDVVTPAPMIVLPEGTLRGRLGTGFQEYLGIPYAAPPVGPLRWMPPQPPAHWTGVRDALTTPSHCPQSLVGAPSGDEDCLYINVDLPDPMPHNAPVMVWIHGGAFTLGEGVQADGGTKGDVLASTRGVVVVSMNYRLGALGFMSHPALTAEGGGHSGNYGFLDQRFALQWVHDHIAAFGGDPANVTLFGESAGGISVCAHLASPMSTGLFQRAIVESGPCGLPVPTLALGEAQGQRVSTALGCNTPATAASCMRAATVAEVMAALPSPPSVISTDPMYASWGPVIDGAFFPQAPMALFRAGTFQHVPVMFGWNHDEGTLFVSLANATALTADQYPAAVLAMMSGDTTRANQVVAHYPLSAYPSPWQTYAAALGDFVIKCPARRTLIAMTPFLTSVHAYEFTYPNAGFLLASTVPLGAFHSAEVQFIFGHPGRIGHQRFTGDEETLHQAMMGYWTRFAVTNDPNGESAVNWPAFTMTSDTSLQLDVMQQPEMNVSATACAFWEGLGVYP